MRSASGGPSSTGSSRRSAGTPTSRTNGAKRCAGAVASHVAGSVPVTRYVWGTPFSYAVLVLVGEGGAGPHDLVRMMRQGRVYWAAPESQFYAEPKRLAALGYLDARKLPGRTHERTQYSLTAQGLAALREWAQRPVRYPRVLHEGVVRLLAADLVGEPAVRESIAALRPELDELDALLDQAAHAAASLPHRERYLTINHRLARRLIAAHREWLAEVERELASAGGDGGP
jgi:PadR family transcriptional regulator, regulatory protein AphA